MVVLVQRCLLRIVWKRMGGFFLKQKRTGLNAQTYEFCRAQRSCIFGRSILCSFRCLHSYSFSSKCPMRASIMEKKLELKLNFKRPGMKKVYTRKPPKPKYKQCQPRMKLLLIKHLHESSGMIPHFFHPKSIMVDHQFLGKFTACSSSLNPINLVSDISSIFITYPIYNIPCTLW